MSEERDRAIDRVMRALADLDYTYGVKVKASLTYENGAAIVEDFYDSELVGVSD